MKSYGKVINYNGIYGKIKDADGNEYTLLDKNIIDEEVKPEDNVEFEAEKHKTPEVEVNLAKFVRVLKKDLER